MVFRQKAHVDHQNFSSVNSLCVDNDAYLWSTQIKKVIYWQYHWTSSLISPQLPHPTVCMNIDPTDTMSISTTRLTAVNPVSVLTGALTVRESPAFSLHVLTRSHRNAVGRVKVTFQNIICIGSMWKIEHRCSVWKETALFQVWQSFRLILLQAASMTAESELTEKDGTIHQTHVQRVLVIRALCGVRGSDAHQRTANTLFRDSAACPVTVSEATRENKLHITSMDILYFSAFRLHVWW